MRVGPRPGQSSFRSCRRARAFTLGDLYFEGNAQTFRILRWLEEKHHKYNGLNLTVRTLLGVCKYPYSNKQNSKKHLYEEARNSFGSDIKVVTDWSKEFGLSLRTIDCEVMDLADEIAYASHDLEDALRQRFFNIDDLVHEFAHSPDYKTALPILDEVIKDAREFAMKAEARETADEFNSLFMKELASRIVHVLVCDIGLIKVKGKAELGYMNHEKLADGLKRLTFKAVKMRPDVMRYERMGENVIRGLFAVYMDKSFNKDMVLLPANYRVKEKWERKVKDYISGMMDSFALEQFEKYYGEGSSKKLYHA